MVYTYPGFVGVNVGLGYLNVDECYKLCGSWLYNKKADSHRVCCPLRKSINQFMRFLRVVTWS